MKTLILYATKTGAAREAARRIADKIDGAVVHDLKQGNIPSLKEFDNIIVGSSVYVGMVRKEAKDFIIQNTQALQEKKLGLFLCGMEAEKEKEYFEVNFPDEIIKKAEVKAFLGGIFDPKKNGFMGRMAMKTIAKITEYTDSLDNAKIEQFAKVFA